MDKNQLKVFLKLLGFRAAEGLLNVYERTYSAHNNYKIQVDLQNEKIKYQDKSLEDGERIKVGDLSTSNFSKMENFIVLECVNRLLEKGYSPNKLSLEHKFPLGRELKGKLDILVFDNDDKAFLMIECKTWGEEYNREIRRTLKNGGQIFSYYVQDTSAKYLCLYTSKLFNSRILYENSIIKVGDFWHELNNHKEIHAHWNKNFEDNGIFDAWSKTYDIKVKALTKGRLKKLTKEDSSKIFNQFLEILRHNVVSDKPNAFNKMLNLFICKIYDENRNEDQEVDFQWKINDTHEDLQKRLNDLYKRGMDEFLDIQVTDYSDEQIEDLLYSLEDEKSKRKAMRIFEEIRLQKNPEFAFIEVFDQHSFARNAIIIKEVVELLQPYQFRYKQKQQFLGDFFELLLSTSIKQESGQFFTPIPIAKFIVTSLPLKEMIQQNIDSNNTKILPVAIDYAVGSGHFLTEYMDQIQHIIEGIDVSNTRPNVKRDIEVWSTVDKYAWAREYVYGIDADYRLVKTAKVSSFLNGDGEANIIHGNGLDHFVKSKDYKMKLSQQSREELQDNGEFSVLIANPPYSVQAFKSTIPYGKESFILFDKLTDRSSEIECLFVERAKQLLGAGGIAGIILPSSMLNNLHIYSDTREILMKYFEICSIVELGPNTFMETGTNTVVLFLRRRKNDYWKAVDRNIEKFFREKKDFTVCNIEEAFSKYVSYVYGDEEIKFDDYISILNKKPNKKILHCNFFEEYIEKYIGINKNTQVLEEGCYLELLDESFYEFFETKEKYKMFYFLLAYPQLTVLVSPGKTRKKEKEFLGYEFSKRRGQEGISFLPQGGKLSGDDFDRENNKINTYIHKAFLGKRQEIHPDLKENIKYISLANLFRFSQVNFNNQISLIPENKVVYEEYWKTNDLVSLKDIAHIEKGTSITRRDVQEGNVPVIAGGIEPAYMHSEPNRVPNVITVSASGANAGYVNYWNVPIFASDCNTIISRDENKYLTKLIYYYLKEMQDLIFKFQKGQAQPHVYGSDLENIKIPSLLITDQIDILDKLVILENKIEEAKLDINVLSQKIRRFVDESSLTTKNIIRLDKVLHISRGASPRPIKEYLTNDITGVNWIKIGDVDPNSKFITNAKERITVEGAEQSRKVKKGDFILSNSMSVGRPYILQIDGCIHDGWLLLSGFNNSLDKDYLYYVLSSDHVQNQFQNLASGGTTVNNLNISKVSSVEIPFPELEIQKKLVKSIINIENSIEELTGIIEEMEQKKKKILFSGVKDL